MVRYTIFCVDQTEKASKLGAPLEREYFTSVTGEDIWSEVAPTAEQMLGWLRSKGFRFSFDEQDDNCSWQYRIGDWFKVGSCSSPREATHAAINAALEYLSNKK